MSLKISVDQRKIEAFCLKHHIRKLAFFGSVLGEKFKPDSDVDVLVEFEPDHIPGFAFFSIQTELSELIGFKVDLNTPEFLSCYFRDEVLKNAKVQYEAAA